MGREGRHGSDMDPTWETAWNLESTGPLGRPFSASGWEDYPLPAPNPFSSSFPSPGHTAREGFLGIVVGCFRNAASRSVLERSELWGMEGVDCGEFCL